MNAVDAMPLPRLVRIYAADAGYEFLRLLRVPSASVPMLAFPAMFYLLFGVMFGHHGVQQAEPVLRRLLAEDATVSALEVQRAGLAEAFTELTREVA